MKFAEREKARLVAGRDELFKDPGQGLFFGTAREFVLSDTAINLWPGIREDALDYFARNQISWWKGDGGGPTGHLLSSQIACVNHLFALRQRPDLAGAVLRALDGEIVAAEYVDDGFVEFEFIGARQYLKERAFSRGANCTSLDAFMIGRTIDGSRRAFLIEWKYTETSARGSKYIPERAKVYDELIVAPGSPFKALPPESFYYEPFYQLMRQTLLGQKFQEHQDHGCLSYKHIHVVPTNNIEFRQNVTSPALHGSTVSEAWANSLRNADLFISTTPANFLLPVVGAPDTKGLTSYLERRYWAGV